MLAEISTKSKSPKSMIIDILSLESPLSSKQIYNKIKKKGMSINYHKVYGKLKDLVHDNILIKNGVQYTLNIQWIDNTTIFMQNIQNKSFKRSDTPFERVSEISAAKILTFKTLEDFMEFWNKVRIEFVKTRKPNEDNRIMWLGKHVFAPLLYTKQRVSVLNEIKDKKIKYYVAIRGNSYLDKCMMEFYKGMGINTVQIGVNDYSKETVFVYNDTAIILLYNDLMDKRDKICEGIENINDFKSKVMLCDLIQTKSPFNVVMIKSKKIAKYYKDKIYSLIHSDK